ncbi:glycosyltransferase family 25 protein [Photobacterium phosphoreum]|uniref:glycosyltransferase family 25 protein n=1 Tax=Photobacterium phosphoreum TaxID=659 RepID=UPI001E3D392D|nr:glycosyltransferase family 25 protein [Photobacterium phosphoreum]MCD9471432.1 epitope biosynthesis protein [Photobacterium phosphoreum]
MTNIFIINIPSSVHRKENISQQLDQLNLNYSFFNAINGHKDNHPLFAMYDDHLSQAYRGKSLSKGQLGCYASHYLLWQKCIELNQPIIILEDDALIYPKPFMDIINNLDLLTKKYECIRLFDNKRPSFFKLKQLILPHTSIYKFSKGHMSATGYLLTPAGANKLLEHSNKWYMAVDIYMDRFWVNHLECYGTVPACLTNDPVFDSDIGYGKRAPRSLACKIKRELFNFKELIRREYYNIKFILKMTFKR